MNNLSWLIYLANTTNNLNGFCMFLTICAVIATALGIIVYFVTMDETDQFYRPIVGQRLETQRRFHNVMRTVIKIAPCFMIVFGVLTTVLPDRQTVLLIAASEIGERVVTSQAVQNVVDPSVDLLKLWIQQQSNEIRKQMETTMNHSTTK